MAILTLTPDRCGEIDGFAEGSYAYAFADRAVRKDGALITAQPLHVVADDTGTLVFDLTPATEADDAKLFAYTVAAFDPTGRRIWMHNIIMPNTDTEIYDLVNETVDLDAPIHVPTVCTPPPPPSE